MTEDDIRNKYAELIQDVKSNEFYTRINLENRVNCYVCSSCNHITKTQDIDAGVTPMYYYCEKCSKHAKSTGYKDIAPHAKPTQVWYRPGLDELIPIDYRKYQIIDHVLRGGLITKPVDEAEFSNN